MIGWHRLFGLGLTDLFTDTGFGVELERDLSIRKQILDVILIKRSSVASLPNPPDGLEDLAAHNLLTYKSHQEALDDFALDELLGHYVNYRKQITLEDKPLLPVEDFRLLAVCTRFPEKLARQMPLQARKPGVLDIQWGTRWIRVIVLSAVEPVPRNALWELFSAVQSRVQQGRASYRWKQKKLSSVLEKLYNQYQVEGMNMPYTVEDYERDLLDEIVTTIPPDKVLRRYQPEDRLRGLPPEDRLRGLPPEELLELARQLNAMLGKSTSEE